MERLGVVAAGFGGSMNRRAYAGPIALLVAATIAIGLLQAHARSPHAAPTAPAAHRVVHVKHQPKPHRFYVVRAGDTLDAIATRSGVPLRHLLVLNPNVSPTALFIGEKLNLK